MTEEFLIPESIGGIYREGTSKTNESNTSEEKDVCPICGKKAPGTGNLSFHMALHPVDRPQVCEFCVGVYRSKDELLAHVKEAHQSEMKFMCETCGRTFNSSARLVRHQKKHTVKNPYKCVYCDHEFRNYDLWRHHEVRHRGHAPYKCNLCDVGFWVENHLTEHNIAGKCTDTVECCGQFFETRMEYAAHYFDKHHRANLEEHPCSHCKRLFPYASTKTYHEKMCRKGLELRQTNGSSSGGYLEPKCTDDGVYMCSICDLGLKTLRGFKLHHQRQHAPPVTDTMKRYNCSLCEKKFLTITALYSHKQTHIKRHVCTVCSKKFAHPFLLRNHMYTHDQSNKPFPCNMCEKSFITKVQLMAHETCHTGFRPYKCRYCTNRFKRRTALIYHEMIHTGVKPYKCKICGCAFTQSSTCRSHERAHERTEGKRKFHCKDCSAHFWSVTQLKTHKQMVHDQGNDTNNKIQLVTEDGETHWVEPTDMTTDEEGNVFYYVSTT